ncbi:hypothetical protein [Desulfuromonas sp.]|nr:hypothetical protein [Desulfuromonas sp.]
MGEAAKAFWIDEEELAETEPDMSYEDISLLCTGESDDSWKFGSD